MQVTATYDGQVSQFHVHRATCPKIPLLGEPGVHEVETFEAKPSMTEISTHLWAGVFSPDEAMKHTQFEDCVKHSLSFL
jgi:hypothetical protein